MNDDGSTLEFQSTHPLRGATSRPTRRKRSHFHFNPRTPCGVRRRSIAFAKMLIPFQSTHPLRGATPAAHSVLLIFRISIHAPLAGCDQALAEFGISMADFNPRTPCGVRPRERGKLQRRLGISIHAPLAGCDLRLDFINAFFVPFQSTHPLRGATNIAHF